MTPASQGEISFECALLAQGLNGAHSGSEQELLGARTEVTQIAQPQAQLAGRNTSSDLGVTLSHPAPA